jgi:hypothetical protein
MGTCQFDGHDHEGELRLYQVRQDKWFALKVKPMRIRLTSLGGSGEGPGQSSGSTLCERHGTQLGASPM